MTKIIENVISLKNRKLQFFKLKVAEFSRVYYNGA